MEYNKIPNLLIKHNIISILILYNTQMNTEHTVTDLNNLHKNIQFAQEKEKNRMHYLCFTIIHIRDSKQEYDITYMVNLNKHNNTLHLIPCDRR